MSDYLRLGQTEDSLDWKLTLRLHLQLDVYKRQIITYGNTTHFCLHAAERLEKEGGWKVEVIDIRSLIPLDKETIFESVKDVYKRQPLRCSIKLRR